MIHDPKAGWAITTTVTSTLMIAAAVGVITALCYFTAPMRGV